MTSPDNSLDEYVSLLYKTFHIIFSPSTTISKKLRSLGYSRKVA